MIVKVQTDSTGKKALIYDRKRSFLVELFGQEARELIGMLKMKAMEKRFYSAFINKSKKLMIDKRLPEQDW